MPTKAVPNKGLRKKTSSSSTPVRAKKKLPMSTPGRRKSVTIPASEPQVCEKHKIPLVPLIFSYFCPQCDKEAETGEVKVSTFGQARPKPPPPVGSSEKQRWPGED